MSRDDFLLEIGCEELPPLALKSLSRELAENIENLLQAAQLSFEATYTFATPRRLAVLITHLVSVQESKQIERLGPNIKAAYDKNGMPTLACLGFARSCGVSTDQLTVKQTDKGERVCCRIEEAGKTIIELMPDIVANALNQLSIPKAMKWGEHTIHFVRPVHWVVMMFGSEVIPASILGKKTTAETYGHRFHHPKKILISHPRDYQQLLLTIGFVIADFEKRRHKIEKLISKVCEKKGRVIIDERLLDEVTAMVEWPVALCGQFNEEFLDVPTEALMTSMKVHQKCFPIVDQHNHLLPYFVLVSNLESKNPDVVIHGNERVINARLSDAAFFYDNDLNRPLQFFLEKLKQIEFQKSLGTLYEKSERLAKLVSYIADTLNEDSAKAKRAALLAKCDLASEMVSEFPELQGVMGYYYAQNSKEDEAVSLAIKEHYYPRFSKDRLPNSRLSAILALADRLDTLIGIISINKIPTGDKDPFGLRRAALGVIRLLIEKELSLDLMDLLEKTHHIYSKAKKGAHNHVVQAQLLIEEELSSPASLSSDNNHIVVDTFNFIIERLRSWYLEKGVAPVIFSAVLECRPTNLLDFDRRIFAVQQFQQLPEANALAAANKRVGNILKKQEYNQTDFKKINASLFENDAEKRLAEQLKIQTEIVNHLYQEMHYTQALTELSKLKEPIDLFFDQVMVLVEDEKRRMNRLALLSSLKALMSKVADISLLS